VPHGSIAVVLLALAALSVPAHACPTACAAERLGPVVAQHQRLPFVAPPPAAAAEPQRVSSPPSPIEIEHGPRYPARFRHADRRLLMLEINNVARLLRVTPRDSRDRPRVLRRLADDYAELAASARSSSEARIKKRASERAIALYQTLSRDHRRYCHSPARKRAEDRGCNDEVLHYLAAELVQAGKKDEAFEAHQAIVRSFPRSPFAAHALLAIGERHFEQSRWQSARRAYRAALARTPDSELGAYAHYKLGHVVWSSGDPKTALLHFVSALELSSRTSTSAELVRFNEAARRDLVFAYAQAGTPEGAFAAFSKVIPEKALPMMEQLARRFVDSAKHSAAIVVYRELLDRKPRCSHRVAIARAVAAEDPNDKQAIRAALDELRSADDERCRDATAQLLFETAALWHAEALGSGKATGTGDRATVELVNELYGWLSDFSDASGLPTAAVLRYRHADVLHALERWSDCGRVFFDAFAQDPKGDLARDALSASAGCWVRARNANPALAARTFERARCLLDAPTNDRAAAELHAAITRAHACP